MSADPPTFFADPDGAQATSRALSHAGVTDARVAVWVGTEDDPDLAEMRAELGARP